MVGSRGTPSFSVKLLRYSLREVDFQLHESHAFRNYLQGYEFVGEVGAQLIDRGVIDFIDPCCEMMLVIAGDDLALVSIRAAKKVVQSLEKGRTCGGCRDKHKHVARNPRPLI